MFLLFLFCSFFLCGRAMGMTGAPPLVDRPLAHIKHDPAIPRKHEE